MPYEVEMKFPVSNRATFESHLKKLGATISAPQTEVDVYFSHPTRDFAKTDEALRIRHRGTANSITYKGPKIDAATKTRSELDLPLPPGESTVPAWFDLLAALGFQKIREVRKSRRKAVCDWQNRRVEISLDEIAGLGHFVELELIVEPADLEPAKICITSLADRLGLAVAQSIRKSYLELLLEQAANR